MKTDKEEFIDLVLKGFVNNKGKSSVYSFNKDITIELITKVLINFHNKHPEDKILIVVDSYNTRINLLNYFKNNITNYEEEFSVKILSTTYISLKYKYYYNLIITVGLNDDYFLLFHLNSNAKFMLTILTENIMNTDFILNVRNILPNINASLNEKTIERARIYSPVKEYQVAVSLNNDDRLLYNKCTDFINTSVKIFGDIKNIEKCKNGVKELNISSSEYRYNLAISNGWSETLDTTIEFQKQIDDIYNPNLLFERACTFYNITKQRRDLVTDNEAKLKAIEDIYKYYKGYKIIIVSKRGEFAKKVTEYINKNFGEICGDYHDCIDDCVAVDILGEPILVKSGVNKGKPKIVGAQAISTRNENYFNNSLLNILSIKSTSNKKLSVKCSIIIFTSPICDNIFEFKTRFPNINIDSKPVISYKLYCENTIEENILLKEPKNKLIEIINDNKNFVKYDENSGDIIL